MVSASYSAGNAATAFPGHKRSSVVELQLGSPLHFIKPAQGGASVAQSPKLASGSKASPGVGIGAGNVHVYSKDAMIGNLGAGFVGVLE